MAPAVHSPGDPPGLQVVGLTADGRLVRFDAATPGRAGRIGSFRPSAQVADIAIPLDQG